MAVLTPVQRTLYVGMIRQGKTGEQLLSILNIVADQHPEDASPEAVETQDNETEEVSQPEAELVLA